jgi:SRSO17 transposase
MWGMLERQTRRPRTGTERLSAYLDEITAALGHASRTASARAYCTGLLLPGERKSVEPMAARIEPGRVQARHQSMHHVVAKAEWDDAAMLRAVRERVLPAIERHGPIRHWIVDDTGFPKQGKHSVGVARQYCGQLGKQGNCQVAVTLSVANDHASLPIAHRLYRPQARADDPARRTRAGVPQDVAFQSKPQIALVQLRAALDAGVPPAPVLADAGYGVDTDFRDGITELGLRYIVGIQSSASLWPPGAEPLPPKPWSGRGGPPCCFSVRPSIKRSRPSSWRPLRPSRPGAASRGARAAMPRSPPASRPCAFVQRTESIGERRRGRKSGCWSSGLPASRSRPNTGSPRCPRPPGCAWRGRRFRKGGTSSG